MVVQSAGLPDGVRLLSLGAVVAVSGLSYSTVSQSSPGLQYNNIDRHSLPPSLYPFLPPPFSGLSLSLAKNITWLRTFPVRSNSFQVISNLERVERDCTIVDCLVEWLVEWLVTGGFPSDGKGWNIWKACSLSPQLRSSQDTKNTLADRGRQHC